MKILVIDDEIDLLDLYQDLLEDEGYEIIICSSGEEGLEHLKKDKFSLIICDNNMGEVSGVDVLSFLEDKSVETPFFLATGDPSINLEFKNAKSKIVRKPVDFTELLNHVEAVKN